MNQIESLIVWLKQWFHNERWKPNYIGIFGSFAKNLDQPRDYDLLIVVQNSVNNEQWRFVSEKRVKLIRDGALIFSPPLSPTILSVRELNETNDFMESVISHPIIHVLGNLDEWIEE